MATNNIEFCKYILPDGELKFPTWSYLSTEITKLCFELTTQLETQNGYLESMIQTVDTWPKKTDPNDNQTQGE